MSPAWEPDFSAHSHGFRPGRSAHDAVKEVQDFVLVGKTWVVDIDLDPLDKELENRGLAFVRYADDIAIFANSQRGDGNGGAGRERH